MDNNEGVRGIAYDMIIGRNLMGKLGLVPDFKCNILDLDGGIVPMKDFNLGNEDAKTTNKRNQGGISADWPGGQHLKYSASWFGFITSEKPQSTV